MKNLTKVMYFLSSRAAKGPSLSSDGIRLWSYSTVIAQWSDHLMDTMYINASYYSRTTTRHLRQLLQCVDKEPNITKLFVSDGQPRRVTDLESIYNKEYKNGQSRTI